MLTIFGAVAVSIMFLSYWTEERSKWLVLVFAIGSGLTSLYSGLEEVYPITVIEALWALIAERELEGQCVAVRVPRLKGR